MKATKQIYQDMDYVCDPSLELYLPLYLLDGSSFMSRDAHGHLCAATGAIWTPQGRTLDGTDDFITIPDHASLDLADAITMIAWIKTSSIVGSYRIVDKYSTTGYTLATNNDTVYIGIGDTTPTWKYSVSAALLNTADWFHVAGIYDKVTLRCFVNGQASGTPTAWTVAMGTNNADVLIGIDQSSTGDFVGSIGEVRIYNRVLSSVEVINNYLSMKWRY